DNRKREFASGDPGGRSVDLAGAKILLGDDDAPGEINETDRIVVIIGDQSAAAVGADGNAGSLRLHTRAQSSPVAERDLARPCEARTAPSKQIDGIVDS